MYRRRIGAIIVKQDDSRLVAGRSDSSALSSLRASLWTNGEFVSILFAGVVSASASSSHTRAARDSNADADAKYPADMWTAATAAATAATAAATTLAGGRSAACIPWETSR